MWINNHQLHVETHGPPDGPPLVFLHHGLGSTLAWRRQITDFTRAGYRLLIYDRWGYGRSQDRPHLAVPGFEDDLADLGLLLDAFHLATVTLIGHSDGGSIALYYAAAHPERVTALVTVAAHIYLEPKMEPGIEAIHQAFQSDESFQQGLARVHGEKYASTFYNWYHGWHTPAALDWDMRPLLSGIRCPTLVIQGEEDEHATPQHARQIAQHIPGAQLWLAPGARHMLPQEISNEFNRRVLDFLAGVHLKVARDEHGDAPSPG
jgi:pimeloyl-ACP methyl ester carboxylesterase